MQQRQHVQYVQQQPVPQQRQQYVQGANGGVYAMPTNDGRHYTTSAPPMMATTTAPVMTTTIPATTVMNDGRKQVTTTTVTKTPVRNEEPLVKVMEAPEGHMMVANVILAGFLLFSFESDQIALTEKQARVLSLKLVAFGCFISAVSFYGMFLQYGRKGHMKSWVFCAQMLSMFGIILLIAAVAMVTRIQLIEEFETVWIASVTVMLVLVILPVICNCVYCCTRLVGEVMDGFDDLW